MRRYLVAWAICASLVVTPALAKTKPQDPPQPSGSLISYELPSTTLKVAIGFTLTKCRGGFSAKPDVTFTPSVGPTQHKEWRFQLDGKRLESFWKSKKLTLETYPDGSIKSLNGGLSDQTGAIIGSIIKIFATAVALAPETASSLDGKCSTDVMAAIDRVDAITARIKALRIQLSTAPAGSTEGLTKAIDALAAEVARLQTNELHIDLSKEFVMERGVMGAIINWRANDFRKWLADKKADFPVTNLSVGLCFRPAPTNEDAEKLVCDASQATAKVTPEPVTTVTCANDPDCGATIVMREPKKAVVLAIATGPGFDGVDVGESLKKGSFMASQWGDLSYLPLTVGFGKSINFAMGFDEYGHKTSQTWDTTARGSSILSSASTAAESLAGIYKTLDGAKLAEMKAETDAINAEKALNQARFCKAVYDAGGFNCP